MGEKYEGRKFRTTFVGKEVPEETRSSEIIEWGKKFHSMGLFPEDDAKNAGNMSFRNSRGFVITSGGSDKRKLHFKDLVQVVSCNIDTMEVEAEGVAEPSSETMLHNLIYSERQDINAIIHVHDRLVLGSAKDLGIPVTKKKQEYGTPELAREVAKVLGHESFIAIKDHGIVSMGKSVWEAGKQVQAFHNEAVSISGK